MTRVLICHQPVDGGVGRHIRDLTVGLAERGYEITLCGPSVPDGVIGVDHKALDLRRAIAPAADLADLAGLARIVRDVRPDIVHAHSSKAGVLSRLARLVRPGTPLVYTPHGYAFAGHFSRPGEQRVYRAIERALAPLVTRVVCVCEAEATLARTVGPSDRVRVVHNGVDPAGNGPPDPPVAELAERGPVIGALTQLRAGKGLETLIDAMPTVLARHPRAQLAICGEGPDREDLRRRARERGAAQAVHFLGTTTRPLDVLRAIDVFVHPSWAESFPYVVLEAMSLARPIVASDVGGIGEALVDGESGLLVPSRDAAALARALVSMLDDHARRTQLGEMALERMLRLYTLEAMLDRLVGVYDELVRYPSPAGLSRHTQERPLAENSAR
jgi:glycosyltransferase involved in cell wall biosynthesis